MPSRTVWIAGALVALLGVFFALIWLFAGGSLTASTEGPVLRCDADPPVSDSRLERLGVTPFEEVPERHRQAFRESTAGFHGVSEPARRYFDEHPRIRYQGEIYLCETGQR